jgi:hypothetical protein
MYQVSQQLTDIVKPMVDNEVKKVWELEAKQVDSSDRSVTFTIKSILMTESYTAWKSEIAGWCLY